MTRPAAYQHVDLTPFLPSGWADEVEEFAEKRAFTVQQEMGGPGSIGYGTDAGIDYRTAMRPEIVEALPWAEHLHTQTIPVLMNLQGYGGLEGDPRADGTLIPVQGSHGIVMNLYDRGRKGIEWHRDGADVYLNVILSTSVWAEGTGGRLLVHDGAKVVPVPFPYPGVGVVALTGDYPHTVEPLVAARQRLILLFSYTNPERRGWREESYNDHFYAGRD